MIPFSLLTSELLILTLITTLCVFLGAILLVVRSILSKPPRHHTALVLVLGDIGRSPRMMYHASSLARHDWIVSLAGYNETPVIPALAESPRVKIYGISNPPRIILDNNPWILRAILRIYYQIWSVLKIALWDLPCKPEVLLVQNPPSIPTLMLVQLIYTITGTKVIIDWHNTGCSILALRVGQGSPLVKAATWLESTFGRMAYAHLFVTRALRDHLVKEWNLQGRTAVLHDRPPAHFHRSLPMDEHEALQRLSDNLDVPLPPAFAPSNFTPNSTTSSQGTSKPALVVSSTSWTADEDFSPLITALDAYQSAYSDSKHLHLPQVLVIITGKGALRSQFERTVAQRETSSWKDFCVRCAFVPSRDYPLILGSADLGISVHSSSSGMDLPMKIVDMFGCSTPVLARGFQAVGELVKEGVNGRVWTTPEELGNQLIETLSGFPKAPALARLQTYFEAHPTHHDRFAPHHQRTIDADMQDEEEWCSWDDNWDRVMHRGVLHRGA